MDKGKKLYFGILVLSILLTSIFYGSYAIFTSKTEGKGKLNIVAGTLDYKIESSHLRDNQLEVDPYSNFDFIMKITSLNSIDSKYEIYYNLSKNVRVDVGYDTSAEGINKGIIGAKETKEIRILIRNYSNEKVIITFGAHGGLSNLAFDDLKDIGNSLQEMKTGDVIFAWAYTGEKETPVAFPEQKDGYRVSSVECNGVSASFNNITWELSIPKTTGTTTICNFTLTDAQTMNANTVLRIGDEVAGIDGSRWHVLENSNSGVETVTLLSDYNLNDDGTYMTNCGRFISNSPYCNNKIFDSDNTNVYDENDSNNIGYFIKNVYKPKVTADLPGTTNVSLPKVEQITAASNTAFVSGSIQILNNFTATTNYWTSDADLYGSSWTLPVYFNFGPNRTVIGNWSANSNNIAGARPVITTPKTNLIAR